MKNNIINLYFTKKKKDLYEYVSLISSMINMDERKLWSKKKEHNALVRNIIEIYVDEYFYYKEEVNTEEILKYLNYNTNVNKLVNLIVSIIVKIYLKEGKSEKLAFYRNELLLLAILISCAIELDKNTSSVRNENIDIHFIRKEINEIVEEKSKFRFYKNSKKQIRKLAELLKENNVVEKNMFKEISSIDVLTYYIRYCDKENFYIFKEKCNIEKLNSFGKFEVDTVAKKDGFYNKVELLGYVKLSLVILNSIISGNDSYFVIEFDKKHKNNAYFNKVDKIFNNKVIKNRVYFLVKDKVKKDALLVLKDNDYKVVYDLDTIDNINYHKMENDKVYLVKEEFLKNNNDNLERFEMMNIEFQVKQEFDLKEENEIVKEIN